MNTFMFTRMEAEDVHAAELYKDLFPVKRGRKPQKPYVNRNEILAEKAWEKLMGNREKNQKSGLLIAG